MKGTMLLALALVGLGSTKAFSSALADIGGSAQQDAAALQKQHAAAEQRLAAAMTIDLKHAPDYISKAVAKSAAKWADSTKAQLREEIAKHENYIASDLEANNRGCDERIQQAIAHYKASQQRAANDMSDIHALLVQLAQEASQAVRTVQNGQTQTFLTGLQSDQKLIVQIRGRVSGETDAETRMTRADSDYLLGLMARSMEKASDQVEQLAAARGFEVRLGDKRLSGYLSFDDKEPVWQACTPGYGSAVGQGQPGYPAASLYYRSCVKIGLMTNALTGGSLAESFSGMGTASPEVVSSEAAYVSGEARSCIDLAGARQAFAQKP